MQQAVFKVQRRFTYKFSNNGASLRRPIVRPQDKSQVRNSHSALDLFWYFLFFVWVQRPFNHLLYVCDLPGTIRLVEKAGIAGGGNQPVDRTRCCQSAHDDERS
jgi:hypothetical protein